MKKQVLLCILGIFLVLCMGHVALGDQESDAKEMVDKAVSMFQEKGKDYALKAMNAASGPFRKGEIYAFAQSFDATMLAHAANRDLVGSKQDQMKDGKGQLIFPPMLETAKNLGSGWVEYWWQRHGESAPTLKRTYIKRVPGEDILVGAGYYVK